MQAYAEAYDIDYELIPGTTEDAVGIASITSARGVDTAGKACTVVTITLTNGETEVFYVYDGEQGEPGEPGEIIVAESFSDVPSGAYYADAVAWAVAKGITTGTGDGRFSPNAPCTRAQVVTFLWRAMGSPEPAGTAGFADVGRGRILRQGRALGAREGHYCRDGRKYLQPERGVYPRAGRDLPRPRPRRCGRRWERICRRAGRGVLRGRGRLGGRGGGITTGTGAGTFSPDAGCTRGQIVTFLFRAAA